MHPPAVHEVKHKAEVARTVYQLGLLLEWSLLLGKEFFYHRFVTS